ncbi:MAG: TusE/DsrC/DsvC family sulfur relay protein [Deltaproteobacteria bacterium]|jgi:tRNA 2-thiouridine synthesizing protein E|nr:TusE/DsrC/DsvC family sulfur relay protein [Deltaproteobacteria bacterium]
MNYLEYQGKKFSVDPEGFLLDSGAFGPEWVELVRDAEEIDEITEEHREIIALLRAYFAERGRPPKVKEMTAVTGYKLKRIYDLFPSGPGKGACKMAGLPKPEGCA